MKKKSLLNVYGYNFKTDIYRYILYTDVFDEYSLGHTTEGKCLFSDEKIKYCLLITTHPDFLRDVSNIRAHLSINELYVYPRKRAAPDIYRFITGLTIRKLPHLTREVEALLRKYRLGRLWLIPLELFVTTGVLPIPFNDWYPETYIPFKGASEYSHPAMFTGDVFANFPAEFQTYIHNIENPAVFFTRRISSFKQLSTYMKEIWSNGFSTVLQNLPEGKFENIDLDTFTFYAYLWKRVRIQNITPLQVSKEIISIQDKGFLIDEMFNVSNLDISKLLVIYRKCLDDFYPINSLI